MTVAETARLQTQPPEAPLEAQLVELFSAIQGEGAIVGTRQIFVRFARCDLRCHFAIAPIPGSQTSFIAWKRPRPPRFRIPPQPPLGPTPCSRRSPAKISPASTMALA